MGSSSRVPAARPTQTARVSPQFPRRSPLANIRKEIANEAGVGELLSAAQEGDRNVLRTQRFQARKTVDAGPPGGTSGTSIAG
jgi:hypothetical protein